MTRQVLSNSLQLFMLFGAIQTQCPLRVLHTMEFALEYAIWRGWDQLLIFDDFLHAGCRSDATIRLWKCLSLNGVASVARGSMAADAAPVDGRLGLLVFAPISNDTLADVLKKMVESKLHREYYDWLIINDSMQQFTTFNEILKLIPFRFDSNVVAAFPSINYIKLTDKNLLCKDKFKGDLIRNRWNENSKQFLSGTHKERVVRECARFQNHRKIYDNCTRNVYKQPFRQKYSEYSYKYMNRTQDNTYMKDFKTIPLLKSGVLNENYTRPFKMTNVNNLGIAIKLYKRVREGQGTKRSDRNAGEFNIILIQYFKVRINTSIYGHYLGTWDRNESMSHIEPPYSVESRTFLGHNLTIGKSNATVDDGSISSVMSSLEDDTKGDGEIIADIMEFLVKDLEAELWPIYFTKVGFRAFDGTWTDMLGAVVDGRVDIAMEPIAVVAPRQADMDFVFPVSRSMRNIYFHQMDTSTVRDIYLAPFNPPLLACVAGMVLLLSVSMVMVSYILLRFRHSKDRRKMELGDGLLWGTGILCQQGGGWLPSSPSASVILISALFFAVVIYNSYAAFITSVLFIQTPSVDSVQDIVDSPDFKIGYIRNGVDQQYLMSTKDTHLNKFYIRGYSDSKNLVSSVEEGLTRAARSGYAFFAAQTSARSTLRGLSQERGRCQVSELPVHSTMSYLAFPLGKNSEYSKPIMISLVRMRACGVLARVQAALVPPMPVCVAAAGPGAAFASARLDDVRSAVLVLLLGVLASAVIGVGENIWYYRAEMKTKMQMCSAKMWTIVLDNVCTENNEAHIT